MVQRIEARLNANDQPSSSIQPHRPDPDPPYGMPWDWKAPSWPPEGLTTHAVAVSIPPQPLTSSGPFPQPHASSHSLGFAAPIPNFPSRSAWDLPLHRMGGGVPEPRSAWDIPPTRGLPSHHSFDPTKHIRMDPPLFDGSDAQGWVTRIQYYFDHISLPVDYRLHYVVMLFSPPASDWIFSYRANNPGASWTQFLDDVRRRFDPNYFVNYIELIAKLTQTGSLAD